MPYLAAYLASVAIFLVWWCFGRGPRLNMSRVVRLDEPLPCFRKKDSCGFVDSDGASAAFSGTALSSFGSSPASRVSPAVAASIADAGLALDSSYHDERR